MPNLRFQKEMDRGRLEMSVNLWKGRDPAYPVQHIITLILSSMLPGT